ncbi:spinster family MFS transporter [Henriciella mobilis]|uniref:MFS transporter n=1 Tax=Henriciella mobilis TaxID=2305467 RepID=A0A399RGT5_9PROT|nr:MFS transporter [Henriciella mobilis]RIJ16350.1 MFS transporter [Henriciella mobilis]RIJ22529.1 MFS transporter [Henriciella mobilis]RIJ29733.1 MFS transporter [Henriciella mobilis]
MATVDTTADTVSDINTGFGSKGYRGFVLGSLLLVYIFNFIDRSIINILTEPIKQSFQVEDWQMGLLGGPAFAILYTMLGIPIARLAERFHRVWIIAISVFVWSLMTALCGVAVSFMVLFLFRVGVSVGEAGCTPPAQSLIADYFAPSSRATAVSIYALGVPLGGMFAAVFAGFIVGNLDGPSLAAMFEAWGWNWALGLADWQNVEGWRVAFILVGIPGILLAFIVKMTIKEPPRGYSDPPELQQLERASMGEAFKVLSKKTTFWHIVAGATVASFVGYGVAQFTTSFLVRTHGLDLQTAAVLFGVIIGLMAALGVFMSGFLADKMAKRYPTALSWMPALGMGLSVPLYAVGFLAPTVWLALPPLMAAAALHYFYLGPMYAIVGGVVDSRMRATSVAITLFIVNLLGYGLGPPLIGFLSTALKGMFLAGNDLGLTLEACKVTTELSAEAAAACANANSEGLRWSIIAFCSLYAWAAIHYLLAGKTLLRDLTIKSS